MLVAELGEWRWGPPGGREGGRVVGQDMPLEELPCCSVCMCVCGGGEGARTCPSVHVHV